MEEHNDDKATSARPLMYGEELLNTDIQDDVVVDSNDDKATAKYVDFQSIKKVSVQLTGLKKIIKDQSDRENVIKLKARGNSVERDRILKSMSYDDRAGLNLPDIPSQKRGGPGKSRVRGATSTALTEGDELEEYSVREVYVERRKRIFLNGLRRSGGNISRACARVGLSRSTIGKWMREDVLFREEMLELSEAIVDAVEDKLMMKIAEGDTYAILFYLKTMGRKRGYTEKVEFEGVKDEFDKMSDDELLREHRRLEAKIKNREGDS